MGEDIFFIIVNTIIGLFHDKKYGCLTAIAVVALLLIIINEFA